MSPGACDRCLRRTWLLGALAPYIERVATGDPGSRSRELLQLEDSDLARAVGGRDADRLLAQAAALGGADRRERVEAIGCWAVCSHDAAYPEALRALRDAPAALLVAGRVELLERLELGSTVSVVGARRAGSYGREVARSLGRDLASAGIAVVSGMALGVDGAAHEGSLAGPGATVAVLGCGPDVAYPAAHRGLYREIRERGLIISELPPGTTPWKWTFPARNRLMAALGAMTVVVAAAERSGSLITTDIATDLGRDVGAVPGPVTASSSAGANNLLAEGASVIRNAQDVLDALLGPGVRSIGSRGPALDPDLADVLDVLERDIGDCDSIAVALGTDGGSVAAALARLELLGYAEGSFSGRYTRTAAPRPG